MCHWTDIHIRWMVKSTFYNHCLIRICSLAVDMINTDEASLYCRCLELITSSPHKMLKMQTMCSSNFSGKEQSLTVPCVLLWLTSFLHRDVACWMWCSRLRASCRLWLPFIESLHYINPPKLAISSGGQNDDFRPLTSTLGGRGMGCRDKIVTSYDPS